jgi:hypothetical protein
LRDGTAEGPCEILLLGLGVAFIVGRRVGVGTGRVGIATGTVGMATGTVGVATGTVGIATGTVGIATGIVGLRVGNAVGADVGVLVGETTGAGVVGTGLGGCVRLNDGDGLATGDEVSTGTAKKSSSNVGSALSMSEIDGRGVDAFVEDGFLVGVTIGEEVLELSKGFGVGFLVGGCNVCGVNVNKRPTARGEKFVYFKVSP